MYRRQTITVISAVMAFSFLFGACKGRSTAAVEPEAMDTDSLKALFANEADTFDADAQGVCKVTFFSIAHATMAICADNKWIYIDANTSAIKPGTDYSTMPKADYMLFTHDHYDHFGADAVEQLSKEGTRIIANPTVIAALGYGDSLSNGESVTTAEGWTVDAVPAYNNSEEKLQFHPQGRDNGYILTIGDLRIYIAGDTEVIPEMADISDIDIAFLPCNLPYTMTPEQCAEAAGIIRPKVLFPYHYSDTDIQKVADLLQDTGIDVRIRQYQ